MTSAELVRRIETKNAPVIVDPRSEYEFNRGHIPGAVNAPVRKILLGRAQLPEDKNCEMVVACMHGQRAVISKWLLGFYGYRNMTLLDGYLEEWIKARLPWEPQGQ